MLSHEETMRLVQLAQQGDEQAKTTLIEQNTPLLKSIIRRYVGKSVEYDDLLQISSIGFLKAIQNFSTEYNVRFSTYAVPMILGEIKRFMRDDGYVKVSRSLKATSQQINKIVEQYQNDNGSPPTVEEIAKQLNMEPAEVVFAMDSSKMPVSIYEDCSDKDGKPIQLIDRLSGEGYQQLVDKVVLNDMLSQLTPRERKLIIMRYYRDMTQGEIADKLGVSQVQVSRLEYKIMQKLKELYQTDK